MFDHVPALFCCRQERRTEGKKVNVKGVVRHFFSSGFYLFIFLKMAAE